MENNSIEQAIKQLLEHLSQLKLLLRSELPEHKEYCSDALEILEEIDGSFSK